LRRRKLGKILVNRRNRKRIIVRRRAVKEGVGD
jgi:hypothetical protein